MACASKVVIRGLPAGSEGQNNRRLRSVLILPSTLTLEIVTTWVDKIRDIVHHLCGAGQLGDVTAST